MKKTIKKLIAMSLAATLTLSVPTVVKAEGKTTELQANQEVTDSLYMNGAENPNVYTFTSTGKGYVKFDFTGLGKTENGVLDEQSSDWCDYKLVAENKEYESGHIYLDHTAKSTDVYAFAKGTTIKLVVSTERTTNTEYYKYTVKAVTTDFKDFEKESNNSRKKATSLKAGKKYSAVITGKNFDTDYYVFKAKKTGKYKITMNAQDYRYTTDVSTNIHCQVSRGKKTIADNIEVLGGKGNVTLFKGKLKKGQKIYIKAQQGTCAYHSEIYSIKVKKY